MNLVVSVQVLIRRGDDHDVALRDQGLHLGVVGKVFEFIGGVGGNRIRLELEARVVLIDVVDGARK